MLASRTWPSIAAWAIFACACAARGAEAPADATQLAQARQAYREGRYEAAAKLYREVLVGKPAASQERMIVLYELGRSQVRLHDGEQAQANARESLAIALSPQGLAAVVPYIKLTLADAQRESGKLEDARSTYTDALSVFLRGEDAAGEGEAHAGLGGTYLMDAHFPEALEQYRQSIKLLRNAAPAEAGAVRVDLASLLAWLGKYDDAKSLVGEAEALCKDQPAAACVAYVDHARSLIAFEQQDYVLAADSARRAAQAFGTAHPTDRARALNNLGISLVGLKRPSEAIAALQEALAAEAGGDPRDIAAATDSLGAAWFLAGRPDLARREYAAALEGWQRLRNREGERDTLANLGELAASQKEPWSAILYYKMSVNIAQALRADAHGMEPSYRASLSHRLSPTYRALAGLLVDQGRLPEANQVSRMLKEDERHEFLRGGDAGDTTAAFAGAEGEQAARYAKLSGSVFAMADELRALNAKASDELSDIDRQRIIALEQRLQASSREVERFIEGLERDLARQRSVASPQATLDALTAIQSTLEHLGHGAVLLRYVLLDNDPAALRIIMVSPDYLGIQAFTVRVPALQVNRTVAAFREAIQKRDPNIATPARQLYDWMFPSELRSALDAAHAATLMVSLDGILRYVPVGALRDEGGWLVERYAIALYNDAGATHLESPPQDAWSAQGFGMTQAALGLPQLTGVRAELEGIIGNAGMPGHATYDQDFTRDHLHDAVYRAKPTVLHIASHFVFRAGTTEDSFLLLGQGRLTLSDLKNWSFAGIDLMTLSACDTATVGGTDANGREIESFASMVQTQGARSVLAALWPVYDPSTAAFMHSFYSLRKPASGPLLTKAQALRAAQLELIRRHALPSSAGASAGDRGVESAPSTAAPNYSHPYYWAPFVLLGNWL